MKKTEFEKHREIAENSEPEAVLEFYNTGDGVMGMQLRFTNEPESPEDMTEAQMAAAMCAQMFSAMMGGDDGRSTGEDAAIESLKSDLGIH